MNNVRAFVSLLLLFFAIACQRETTDVAQTSPSEGTTAASTPQARPPEPNTLNPVLPTERDDPTGRVIAASATQEVHLIEYAINMPATMNAGKVAFNIENGGKEDHGFEIEGNGIEEKTDVMKRGESESLQIDLRPGTYTVYCPVKDHAKRGMKTTITVR